MQDGQSETSPIYPVNPVCPSKLAAARRSHAAEPSLRANSLGGGSKRLLSIEGRGARGGGIFLRRFIASMGGANEICGSSKARVSGGSYDVEAIGRGKTRLKIWSGRLDSNQRPLAPHASALPNCATPRLLTRIAQRLYAFKRICTSLELTPMHRIDRTAGQRNLCPIGCAQEGGDSEIAGTRMIDTSGTSKYG